MTYARLTPLAKRLPANVPFVGPEAQERVLGRPFKARLGANENVFGPSPRAIAAMAETEMWKYGDSESVELRAALLRPRQRRPLSSSASFVHVIAVNASGDAARLSSATRGDA